MNLQNKTILVMGAAGRLGQSIVQEILAQEGQVVAIDHHVEQFEQYTKNEQIVCFNGDVTSALSIQSIIERAICHFGKIDGAVNTTYPRNNNYGRDFLDVTYEDFSENISLHVGGYFLFMQQCIKYALEEKLAFSLVNISSIYGIMAPRFSIYQDTAMTMPIEYAAIKSAIQHMVSYATAYTKGSQFRVNCVSPGGLLADQSELFLKRYNAHCRKKGMLEPHDIVGTIVFLLSDASEYVCGQNIVVDDGFHV